MYNPMKKQFPSEDSRQNNTQFWLIEGGLPVEVAQIVTTKYKNVDKLKSANPKAVKLVFMRKAVTQVCKSKKKAKEYHAKLVSLIANSRKQPEPMQKNQILNGNGNPLFLFLTHNKVSPQVAGVISKSFGSVDSFKKAKSHQITKIVKSTKQNVDDSYLDLQILLNLRKKQPSLEDPSNAGKLDAIAHRRTQARTPNIRIKVVEPTEMAKQFNHSTAQTISSLNKRIKQTRHFITELDAIIGLESIDSEVVCEQLSISEFDFETCKKLHIDTLKADLRIRLESLQKISNCLQINQQNEVKSKWSVDTSALLFHVKQDALAQNRSLGQLLESASAQKSTSRWANDRGFWFTNSASVDQFIESLCKYGYYCDNYDSLERCVGIPLREICIPESISFRDLFRSQEKVPDLFRVKVYYRKQADMALRVDSLILNDAVVGKVTELHATAGTGFQRRQSNQESLSRPDVCALSEFDRRLMRLEQNHGALLDTGVFELGGICVVVCHLRNVTRDDEDVVARAVNLKIQQQEHHWYIDLLRHRRLVQPDRSSSDRDLRLQRALDSIQVKTLMVGDQNLEMPFEEFVFTVDASDRHWKLSKDSPFRPLYLGDLLTLESNLDKLRKRQLSTCRVIEIRSKMFQSLRTRHQRLRITPRNIQQQNLFSQKELTQKALQIDQQLNSILAENQYDIAKALRSLLRFKEELSEKNLEFKTFSGQLQISLIRWLGSSQSKSLFGPSLVAVTSTPSWSRC